MARPKRLSTDPVLAVIVVGMVVIGALVVPWIARLTGSVASPEEFGRGSATIAQCRTSWGVHTCEATLTRWSGSADFEVGQQVSLRSIPAVSGEVEVVGRPVGVSTIDRWGSTVSTTQRMVVSAETYVMPSSLRPVYYVGLGTAWILLIAVVVRLRRRALAKR